MGADFDTLTLDGKLKRSELKEYFKNHQDNCAHESGHSYSGQLNMCPDLTIEDKVFNSYDAAETYVCDTAQKWENAIAVKYIDASGNETWFIGGWCSS